jgi:hypothetical protein
VSSARRDALALLLVAAVAFAYAAGVVGGRARAQEGLAHFDTYAYFYPNAVYALESLQRGEGLLWNRFQNCGQPFVAITLVAALYPLHWLLPSIGIDQALIVLFGLHLLIGGVGAYALGRTLRLRRPAALCGALTFQLGWTTLFLGYWSPMTLAVYAWLPGALAATERLLRGATPRGVALLATLLGLQWLAGYPQVSVFTYQLIALRGAWELATRWRHWRRLLAPLLAIAVAGLLAVGLAAVQLLPGAQVAAHSLRSRSLGPDELRPKGVTTSWESLRESVGPQVGYGATVALGTTALAGLALLHRRRRRLAACYALAAALGVGLAFDTPLFDLYRRLPLGSAFREPNRFLWVTAFAASVLAAIGADALLRAPRPGAVAGLARPLAALLAVLGMAWLATSPLQSWPLFAAAALIVAAALSRWRPARRGLMLVLPLLVAAELWWAGGWQMFAYLDQPAQLWQQREVFAQVRERLTVQQRMYPVAAVNAVGWGGIEDGMMKKVGQLYRLPSIVDYEPQTSARYAELVVRMLWGKPMKTINQYYFEVVAHPRSRPLFDLTAARLVVTDEDRVTRNRWPDATYPLLWEGNGKRIYDNPQALPRARVVGHALAIPDPAVLLETLATDTHDPRATVLLEGGPGEIGRPMPPGRADIVADHGERVSIAVRAPAPGWLVLADQEYPGWNATVNGTPETILRADYAFRAVAVPAGDSQVELRYQPLAPWIGALLSGLSALLAAALAFSRRRLDVGTR